MKLYRKQLNSLEELKRERIRLKYERKHSNAQDLFSKSVKSHSDKEDSGNGILPIILGLLGGGSMLQTVLTVGGPLLKMMAKGKPKRIAGSLVKRIIITFIIGKGIQLAVKGISRYVKAGKEKKEMKQASERYEQTQRAKRS